MYVAWWKSLLLKPEAYFKSSLSDFSCKVMLHSFVEQVVLIAVDIFRV